MTDTPTKTPEKPVHRSGFAAAAREFALIVVGALIVSSILRAFVGQMFIIPSESMENTLLVGDRVVVEKLTDVKRGDVVVFEDPGGWLGPDDVSGPTNPVTKVLERIGLFPSGGHLVKRVIGVAGDTITCCDNQGRLSVNGVPVDESGYTLPGKIDQHDCYGPMTGNCSWSVGPVPEGHVFVMGDNRAHSADSTVHMCLEGETECTKNPYVDVDSVVGKVFALVWPLSRFGGVGGTDAFDKVPDAH